MNSLLDTSVVSQRVKEIPDPRVLRWFQQTPEYETFLSVMTLEEIRAGVDLMSAGRKQDRLEQWVKHDLRQSFSGRLLLVDDRVAEEAGRIAAKGKTAGAEPELADALIAATAVVHGLKLATLNRKHFERLGVELVEF